MSPSGSPFLKIRAIAMECSGWTERGHVSGVLLLRASNSMQYRDGHEVFSTVTSGPRRAQPSRRPLSFSTTYQWGKPQSRLLGGKCGGGKNPLQISLRKDQAGSLGAEEKTSWRSYTHFGYVKCKQ